MSAIDTLAEDLDTFEIRTLGTSAKRSRVIRSGETVKVGYDLDNDIVVRESSFHGHRLEVRLGRSAATIKIRLGEVILFGQTIAAPAEVILPPYVVLQVGEVALAFGAPDSPRWEEAQLLLRALLANTPPTRAEIGGDLVADELSAVEFPSALSLEESPRRPRVLIGLLSGAAIICATAAAGLFMLPGARDAPQDPQIVQRVVREAGFGRLTVRPRPGLPPLISGTLADDLAVSRLTTALLASGVQAKIAVKTEASLARQVEDGLQTAGIAAEVTSLGAGRVLIAVATDVDPLRLDQTIRTLRASLPELRDLRIENSAPRMSIATALASLRIDDIHPDPDGFITLSDGGRYFTGATLPTGQVLAAVDKDFVRLERDGVATKFAYQGANHDLDQ
jgi:type III secretion protein D